jgi:uncharacterized membrane protein YcaP (DUF421 family)
MQWLYGLFGEKNDLSTLQECARAIMVFLYGLALVRIAGRRMFGKWSALDIVVSIIIGSNLSRVITGNAPFVGTLAATTLLVAFHWVLANLCARWPTASRIFEGAPVVLSRDGSITHRDRIRESVSDADLSEALRQSGVERAEEAAKITLEPSGKITVLKSTS